MAEYVSLYTSGIHRRSMSDTFAQFRQNYQHEESLSLLYRYPADWTIIGEMHRHNTDFGFKEVSQASNGAGCPCCKTQYRVTAKDVKSSSIHFTPTAEEISEMKQQKEAYRLGSEVAAFFTQAKIIFLCLMIRLVIFDFVLFVKAYFFSGVQYSRVELTKHSHLVDEDYIFHQQLSFPMKIVIAFYKYDIIAFQLLTLVIVLIAFFALSHRFQLELYQAIQRTQHYENRYAIIVEGIPLIPSISGYQQAKFEQMSYEKRIKLFFKRHIKQNLIMRLKNHDSADRSKEGLNKMQKSLLQVLQKHGQKINFAKVEDEIVQEVIVCYDISAISRIQREKELIMQNFHNCGLESYLQREIQHQNMTASLKKLNKYHLKLVNYFNAAKHISDKVPYFLGFAIVVFNYQHYRDFLIQESLNNPKNLSINNCPLIIRAAQKPSVVQWGNFVQRKQQQLKSRVYTNLILSMVLLVTLVTLSYLQLYKIIPMIERWLHFPKRYQHRIKVIILSGITSLINLLLSYIIQILAESQKRLSKTGTLVSLITKNVITQFINSALIYYFITFVTPASFLFEMKDLKSKVESLIIFPGIVRIAVNFVNAKYLFKKFQFEIYSKNNFQIQFNKLYERPDFDLVGRYTYYIVQILTVSFYAPLSPMIMPALACILPAVYYVDRLILINKSSQPPKVSFRVTDWVQFLCECSLLSFMIGWILFCPQDLWTDFVENVTYFCLILVLLYLGYRLRMVNNVEDYFCHMKKSTKSHNDCSTILMQKFKNYDPWKCYLKPSNIKAESCTRLPK